MKIISVSEHSDGFRKIIKTQHRFLFWTWERRFVGSGTVWTDIDSRARAGTLLEGEISGQLSTMEFHKA